MYFSDNLNMDMIEFVNFIMMLTVVGIIGFTLWIWKYKSNWSMPKKVLITTVAIGLIVAMSIGVIVFTAVMSPGFSLVATTPAGQAISSEEVNSQLNKSEYAEISEAELMEYPGLKISMGTYTYFENRTEWKRIKNFLNTKWLKRSNQFVINKNYLEDELNKSIVTAKMRDTFVSKGYTIPEKSYIKQDGDKWYVMTRFAEDEITYEIQTEDGKLKIVYVSPRGNPVYKIREKYFKFIFLQF